VLALQRTAGNRAVVAMLARTAGATAPAKRKETHAILPEIGTIPLLSFSWGEGGHGREGRSAFKELSLMSEQGEHSAALMRAAAEGTPLGTVEVVLMKDGKPYGRIKLHNVIISSFSTAGSAGGDGKPTDAWTLNAEKIEWEFTGAGGGSGGGRPPATRDVWDYDAPG